MAIEKVVYHIPKESYDYIIKQGFVDDINTHLLDELGDCVMRNLVAEGEIVVKLLELRKEEFTTTNSIQFKRQISWKPLVRCEECIHHDVGLCHRPKWSFAVEPTDFSFAVEPTDFCSYGERRSDDI